MTILEKWPEPKPVKLTIEHFLRLDETGAFKDYAKTELIGGTIVAMNAQHSTHAQVKSRLFRRIADAVDALLPRYEAWTEVSVSIPPNDLPEPDIVVSSFQPRERAPVPADTIALIVEVADTTKSYDLGIKANLYASAGVPEYWVVDIAGEAIHQLWSPSGGMYAEGRLIAFGVPIAAATISGMTVDVVLI